MLTVEEFVTRELTVEHVPPKPLGGAELLLTCRKCNNDTGSKFGAEAHKQQRLWQFLSGESERPETATFTLDGITNRVEMYVTGQMGMLFIGVPEINRPAGIDFIEDHMRMLSETRSADLPVYCHAAGEVPP
jgi:hypothetical protein